VHACLKRSAWDQEIAYFPARHDEMASREGEFAVKQSGNVCECHLQSHDHNRQPVGAVHPYKHCSSPQLFFPSHLPGSTAPSFSRRTQKEKKKNKTKQKQQVPYLCTWDLLRYAYPIGHISSTSHRVPCTAEAVMPSDHHHHLLHHHSPPPTPPTPPLLPRLTHTQHGVMRHRPTVFFGHIQFAHTRTMPIPPTFAQRRGLQSLIFDLLPVLSTMRIHTRKRPRRHCWKRSKAASRPTSCCAAPFLTQRVRHPITLS